MAHGTMSKKATIHPKHAIDRAIRQIAHEILADARRALEDSSKSHAIVIHDYRRAMKRWRAFLRLLSPILGEESRRLRLQARDNARELASSRDAQSALDAFADIKKMPPSRGLRSPAQMTR